MKDKKYFIISIIISIILPLILGYFYFISVYRKANIVELSSRESARPEAIFEDSNMIVGIDGTTIDEKNYLGAKHFDFKVVYPKGKNDIYSYNISLKETKLSDNINPEYLHWKLLEYNYDDKKYEVIGNGNFSSLDNGNITIGKNVEIGINNIEQFKFYYYLVNDNFGGDYSGSTFESKLYLN